MLTTSPSIQARVGSSTQTWEPAVMLTGVPCETNSAVINENDKENRRSDLMFRKLSNSPSLASHVTMFVNSTQIVELL